MKSVDDKISFHLSEANEIALREVERIVRSVLSNNSGLGGFFMTMGTYCFEDLEYKNLNQYNNKRVDDFISKWDSYISLTGNSICLRKDKDGSIHKIDW